MITLVLDASTYVGDVALLDDARLLAERSVAMKGAEHERLMPAVVDVLETAAIGVDDIDRVVCGAGPGSFTSLRIAGAIAKGIASGVGAPLFAVPSMALVVGGAGVAPGRYLGVVDALRGEAYVELYEVRGDRSVEQLEAAKVVATAAIDHLAAECGARTIGPSESLVALRAFPRARAVADLQSLVFGTGPVDLASWEPAYGRLAEAQVRWELSHGRPLPAG